MVEADVFSGGGGFKGAAVEDASGGKGVLGEVRTLYIASRPRQSGCISAAFVLHLRGVSGPKRHVTVEKAGGK